MFKPDIVQENTNILNEAYFGSKPVEKILNQLSIARKKYLTNDKLFQDKRYETNNNIYDTIDAARKRSDVKLI